MICLRRKLKPLNLKSITACAINRRFYQWEAVIGLEVHAQISSKTKLFSGAQSEYGAPTNTNVTFLDASIPGTLPRLNKYCVEAAALTALALKSEINFVSKFDRKHYFYADLPAGYQITQQRQPIAQGGSVSFVHPKSNLSKKETVKESIARITQIQLEQDSGKSLHDVMEQESLIDLNRAGCALMEIVTEPDFRSADEAAAFVKELRNILLEIGTCNCKMEEGNLRVDASVSLRKPGEPLGTRSEVKNLNSMRHVSKAIEFEIKRQTKLLENGETVDNETRAFDGKLNQTYPLRDKEKLHDYRFMPEPNLPPLRLYTNNDIPKGLDSSQIVNVDDLSKRLPLLPHEQRSTLLSIDRLRPQDCIKIAETGGWYKFFNEIYDCKTERDPYIINGLLQFLESMADFTFLNTSIRPAEIAELVDVIQQNRLTPATAKVILRELLLNNDIKNITKYIDENSLWKILDNKQIKEICAVVIYKLTLSGVDVSKKGIKNKIAKEVKSNTHGCIDQETIKTVLNTML